MNGLAELEQRVKALEDGAGGADQLNPNVLTVNPDGTIGANLTGHLQAAGVDLGAAVSGTPPSTDELRWIALADRTTSAEMFGQDLPGLAKLFVYANRFRNRALGAITLTANDSAAAGNAGVEIQADTPGGADNNFVRAFVDNVRRLVIDDQLKSDFLQLAATAQLELAIGSLSPVNLPAGWSTWNPATPWLNAHFLFLAAVQPAAGYSIAGLEAGVIGFGAGVGHGFVNINSAIAQTANITWMSIGN